MNISGKRIVLGVTGGVAAYKAAVLTRELQRAGVRVQVVMTEAGTRFVGPATFQALTGEPVFVDQWDTRIANGMAHIELSRAADAIVADLLHVAPRGGVLPHLAVHGGRHCERAFARETQRGEQVAGAALCN